jgi:hypothetical protein
VSSRVGPAAGHELGMPAQQRSRRDQPDLSELGGQQPGQGAEERPVDPRQRRALIGSAQHRDLVSQYEDLGVLGRVGSGEQRKPAQHASEREVGESEGHSDRSC